MTGTSGGGDPDRLTGSATLELTGSATLESALARLEATTSGPERDQLEIALVQRRFEAAREIMLEHADVPTTARPAVPLDGSGAPVPTRMEASELTPDRLSAALAASGCVHVPGLLGADLVEELREGIDHACDAFDRARDGTRSHSVWFERFQPEGASVHLTRRWLRAGGAMFTADSPRFLQLWFDTLRTVGITDVVAGMFGEPPISSLDKCALRRIGEGGGIEWHQDGAFLGADSNAVNLWMSLSDPAQSPGLEIIPRRFDDIVETGTGGATHVWSVGSGVIDALSVETPVVAPLVGPGDALFFDSLLLHRTAPRTAAHAARYAIETWFFRPSSFPDHQQVPLLL